MNADGTAAVAFNPAASAELNPAWSPDGRQVSFTGSNNVSESNLFRMEANGGSVTQITFAAPGGASYHFHAHWKR
jgi:Tol biopolymer transport system component